MSYSFTVKAATKDEAKAAVLLEMDKVVAQQPIHARDKDPTIAAANAMIDLLVDDPSRHVQVHVHGSVSWIDVLRDDLASAQVGVAAQLSNP